jgi:hypothetical protein
MHFKIGEKVKLLQEVGDAVIVRFHDDSTAIIEDETGFERSMPFKELVKIIGNQHEMNEIPSEESMKEEDFTAGRTSAPIMKKHNFWEIDLHTHELLETEAGFSPSELLRHQLAAFRSFFRSAREKHIKKLVIIHGVGEGVLKHEVRQFLSGQDGLEFFDASYREYGKGATEVELFYY